MKKKVGKMVAEMKKKDIEDDWNLGSIRRLQNDRKKWQREVFTSS